MFSIFGIDRGAGMANDKSYVPPMKKNVRVFVVSSTQRRPRQVTVQHHENRATSHGGVCDRRVVFYGSVGFVLGGSFLAADYCSFFLVGGGVVLRRNIQ